MRLPPQKPTTRRGELTDRQWNWIESLLPPQKPHTGCPSKDHRTVINGILWVLRTGAPWRDMPERYGAWSTVAGRFYHWQKIGLWQQLFEDIQQRADAKGDLNWQIHFVDGSVIRAHQHAAGAKRGN